MRRIGSFTVAVGNGVTERVFELAVNDAGRATLRPAVLAHNADHRKAFGRCPGAGLRSVGFVIKALFVHRQAARFIINDRGLRRGHFHVDARAPAVAVRVRDGKGKAVAAFGVRIRRVAVRAVRVHRQRAVLARHTHAFTGQRVALALALRRRDGEGLSVAVVRAEVIRNLARHNVARRAGNHGLDSVTNSQSRYVVNDLQPYFAAGAVAVRIGNGNGKIMVELLVISEALIVSCRIIQNKDIIKAPGCFIESKFKMTAVNSNGSARHRAVLKNGNAAKNDGSNAIGSGDEHISERFRVRFRSPVLFRDTEKTIPDTDSTGSDGDGKVGNGAFVRAKGFQIVKRDVAVRPADIQPAKAVKAIKKVRACVLMITAAVALIACVRGRTGSGHQVGFIHGREEILTGNLNSLHGEGRHVLAGIGRIEIFKLETAPVIEGQDKIVSGAGQRGGIRRKIKNETSLRFTNDILGYTRSGLYKAHIRHGYLLAKEGAEKRK